MIHIHFSKTRLPKKFEVQISSLMTSANYYLTFQKIIYLLYFDSQNVKCLYVFALERSQRNEKKDNLRLTKKK